jgi:Tol biopolymer transport system component
MSACHHLFLVLAAVPAFASAQQPQRPVINGGLPSVSPDGKRIAFVSSRSGNSDLYVVNPDGSGIVRLTDSPEYESEPRWTSDGARVVFSVFAKDTSRVFTIEPSGAGRREIAVVAGRGPILSRDGRSLIYSSGRFPALVLTASALDGSNVRTLTDASAPVFNAVESPDGRLIAFAKVEPATRAMHVWVANADGTGARQLSRLDPAVDGGAQWPAWSADGRRIAVQVGKYNPQARTENTAHIWVFDVASGAATKLAAHDKPYLDETPSFFPDGRIAFQSDRSGRMEVWVMNADGTGAKQITN